MTSSQQTWTTDKSIIQNTGDDRPATLFVPDSSCVVLGEFPSTVFFPSTETRDRMRTEGFGDRKYNDECDLLHGD
jgi:hypothetical protein